MYRGPFKIGCGRVAPRKQCTKKYQNFAMNVRLNLWPILQYADKTIFDIELLLHYRSVYNLPKNIRLILYWVVVVVVVEGLSNRIQAAYNLWL